MSQSRDDRQKDLFRPALEQIIAMGHPLVRLGRRIDWAFLDHRLGEVYRSHDGHPPLPVRLMAGLLILKHMHSLSDEALCARWVENPYFQYFCGEEIFQHEAPFDRSSLTRWRQRLGEERLSVLLQESLRVAHETGALATKDLERVVVDTTVQPKAIAHPTDARLTHRAIVKLVAFAKKKRGPAAAELPAGRQAGGDHGRPLYPCPSVQARQPGVAVPAQAARSADPRYRAQNRR